MTGRKKVNWKFPLIFKISKLRTKQHPQTTSATKIKYNIK